MCFRLETGLDLAEGNRRWSLLFLTCMTLQPTSAWATEHTVRGEKEDGPDPGDSWDVCLVPLV